MHVVQDLIFDIGMSEGDDTDFYLQKGFRVLGVEADPEIFARTHSRFAEALKLERLKMLNFAASHNSGETMRFMIAGNQGHSHLSQYPRFDDGTAREIEVRTIDWPDIVREWGIPHYCKIDIEGAEVPFLKSMAGHQLPEYISTECHIFEPLEILYQIGYRRFRLIHQSAHNAFRAPDPPLEGRLLKGYVFRHSSGYFGRELWGQNNWLGFRDTVDMYVSLGKLQARDVLPHLWFDCHAWMPP